MYIRYATRGFHNVMSYYCKTYYVLSFLGNIQNIPLQCVNLVLVAIIEISEFVG